MQRWSKSLVLSSVLAGIFCLPGSFSNWTFAHGGGDEGEDGEPVLRLSGTSELSPPEGAANQDATGKVHLRQRGERAAIHVRIRHLTPGATYGVSMSREGVDEGGMPITETAELGTITTRPEVAPPPPRCFKARLKPVEEEGGDDGGDGGDAGDGGGAGFEDFWRFFRHRRDSEPEPRGLAVLIRNSEGTELNFYIDVDDVEGAVNEASIDLGEAGTLALTLDEELSGSVAITAEQLAALVAGDGTITVKTDAAETLAGGINPCFPFFQRLQERLAEWRNRRAGSGALRLDTAREDAMPFGVTDLRDLVGAGVSVKDAEGNEVLAGTIGELTDSTPPPPPPDEGENGGDGGDSGDGGGAGIVAGEGEGEDAEDEEVLRFADVSAFFDLPERHDASFIRGDSNDDQHLDISDAVYSLIYLYRGGEPPYCMDAADANDDGRLDLSDPIATLGSVFLGQAALPAPYGARGFDRTVDDYGCDGGR
jgi:hypothetical protein